MRTFLMILLISALCVGCSNDDNKTSILNGKWDLVNVSGGLLGVDQDFEKGTIVWDFNESDQTVTISNNNELQDVYDGLPSGTYPYNVSAPADADVLIVNEINLGLIDLKMNSFTVEELAIDGIKLSFTRE